VVLAIDLLEVDALALSRGRASAAHSVVPVVAATGLPLSWPRLRMPEAFFTAMRTLVTKVVGAKATCFCRAWLLVVEPHSRSTVPLADQRDAVLRGHGLVLDLQRRQLEPRFLTASTMRLQMSMW
jgi:hypothetical protein